MDWKDFGLRFCLVSSCQTMYPRRVQTTTSTIAVQSSAQGQLNVSGSSEVLYLDVIGVLQKSLWGCIAYSCITLDHPELAVSQLTSRLSAGNLTYVQQQPDFTGVNTVSDAKQTLLWEVEQLERAVETVF